MNYLAHLYFSDRTPEAAVGSLAGNFFKGSLERHPPQLRPALALHRAIDAFTDFHPDVTATRRLIFESAGHYGGVVLDVFYDHLLSMSWSRYAREPLQSFAGEMYGLLRAGRALIPSAFAPVVDSMIEHDWLTHYGSDTGWIGTLQRMQQRLPGMDASRAATGVLDVREEVETRFHAFFPELQELVRERSTPAAQLP